MNIETLVRFLEKFEPDGEVFFSFDKKTFNIDDVFDCLHKYNYGRMELSSNIEDGKTLLPYGFEETVDTPMIYIFKLKEEFTAPLAAK